MIIQKLEVSSKKGIVKHLLFLYFCNTLLLLLNYLKIRKFKNGNPNQKILPLIAIDSKFFHTECSHTTVE